MGMREKIEGLRAEALEEALACEPLAELLALDEAVAMLGGERIVPETLRRNPPAASSIRPQPTRIEDGVRRDARATRNSQGDVAAKVLAQLGEPIGILRLVELSKDAGAQVGGANPIANFRSALSKDKRFYSLTHNGSYYWWLTDYELPPTWNEAEPDDFVSLIGSASVSQTSQEGGDGHSPATT